MAKSEEPLTPHDQAMDAFKYAWESINSARGCAGIMRQLLEDYLDKDLRPPPNIVGLVDKLWAIHSPLAGGALASVGPFKFRLASLQEAGPVVAGDMKASSAHELATYLGTTVSPVWFRSEVVNDYLDQMTDPKTGKIDRTRKAKGRCANLEKHMREAMRALDFDMMELQARLRIEAGKLQGLLEEKRYNLVKLNEMEKCIATALRENGPMGGEKLAEVAGYSYDAVRKTVAAMVRHGIVESGDEGYSLPAV